MLALLLFLGTASPPDEVPAILRRQTQEMVDAISTGSAAVWDRYLDPEVRYVDESGNVLRKNQLLGGIQPLPKGVSASIRVTDFDAAVHRETF